MFRALGAIHAGIVFWVGSAGLLTSDALFEPTLVREIVYTLVGLAIVISTDTLRGNAGLPGFSTVRRLESPKVFSNPSNQFNFALKVCFALIGSVFIWTGIYNLLDLYVSFSSPIKDAIMILMGLVGLAATNTLCDMAFIYPPGFKRSSWQVVGADASFLEKSKGNFLAGFSILLQNMVWLGVYNLLEVYARPSLYKEVLYSISGLFLLGLTDSLVPVSWLPETEEREELVTTVAPPKRKFKSSPSPSSGEDESRSPSPRKDLEEAEQEPVLKPSPLLISSPSGPHLFLGVYGFSLRLALSLAGQIVHNTGVWTILDEHIYPDSSWVRDTVYTLSGLVFIYMFGLVMAHAALPSQSPTAHIQLTELHEKE